MFRETDHRQPPEPHPQREISVGQLESLFDADWYLSQYPDVAGAGVDPLQHYIEHGAAERRNPHPKFDTEWYLNRHPDAASSGETPLHHFIRHYGTDLGALTKDIVERIREFQSDDSRWPPAIKPEEEAGIVISGCGRLFRPLYANLRNIREQGCDLPIDVWHLPGEFTQRQIAFLSSFANFVNAGVTPFHGLSGCHEVHGFKAWMLSQSRFRKTLMLDVNSFPMQNLKAVFESDYRCLLWRDGPWGTYPDRIAELRRSLNLVVHPLEFESGQLFVNKGEEGVRRALRFAAALNTLGRRLYAYTYGDKETYSIAFDLLGESFSIAPEPAAHLVDAAVCAHGGLIQPWFDGSGLFYHPLGDRDQWWRFKDEWVALEREAAEAEKDCGD